MNTEPELIQVLFSNLQKRFSHTPQLHQKSAYLLKCAGVFICINSEPLLFLTMIGNQTRTRRNLHDSARSRFSFLFIF